MNVLNDWMEQLSFKTQTVLISSIRRPDINCGELVSKLVRLMRIIILKDACPGLGTFMNGFDLQFKENLLPIDYIRNKEFQKEFAQLTVHSAFHILHAIEIIGYFHADKEISKLFHYFYLNLCDVLHINPETFLQLQDRMFDGKESNCWK